MAANKLIAILQKQLHEEKKKTFAKEIFNESWLKVGEHE